MAMASGCNMMIWIVVSGAVAFAMAVALWFFVLERRRPERSHKLPPGTAGWPLFGDLIPFASRPHEFIKERREMYGDLFRTRLFGNPTVFSTDSSVNKFILHNDGSLFVPHLPLTYSELLGKWSTLKSQGDYHKRSRGAVLRFISSSVLKHRALSEIENIITSALSGWQGRTVNVSHEINEMLFSIIANYLLSLQAGAELEKLRNNYYGLRKGIRSVPMKVPGTTFYKSLQKRKDMCNQITHIIEERNKSKSISSNDSYEDLLSSIQTDAAEYGIDEFESMNEYMVDLFVRLIFAAMETTPKIMTVMVKHLSENPHIISKLKEEHEIIRRTKKDNESLSWDDYKSMSFTKRVIKETMRLGTEHIKNTIMRKAIEDVRVEGYTIPKGWICIVYDGFYSMDTKYYSGPLAFNPQRWQEKNMNHAPFIAFGGGSRICPGNELATLVMSFFIYHLITKKWEYKPSSTESTWFGSLINDKGIDSTMKVESG